MSGPNEHLLSRAPLQHLSLFPLPLLLDFNLVKFCKWDCFQYANVPISLFGKKRSQILYIQMHWEFKRSPLEAHSFSFVDCLDLLYSNHLVKIMLVELPDQHNKTQQILNMHIINRARGKYVNNMCK